MNTKFKVGDLVKYIVKTEIEDEFIGMVGTVINIDVSTYKDITLNNVYCLHFVDGFNADRIYEFLNSELKKVY